MSNYKDFSYYSLDHCEEALNIGWTLEKEFTNENLQINQSLSRLFWDNLIIHLDYSFNTFRSDMLETVDFVYGEKEFKLGYSEIRIIDKKTKRRYATPNLLPHYILNNLYCPPKEFIDAVENCILPSTREYQDFYLSYNKLTCWGQNEEYILKNRDILNLAKNDSELLFKKINADVSMLNFVTSEGSLLNLAILNDDHNLAVKIINCKEFNLNKFNGTELISAVLKQDLSTTELLFSKGIIVENYQLDAFRNPLFIAVSKKDVKLVELILKKTAKMFFVEYENAAVGKLNIVEYAKLKGTVEICELINSYI